MRLLYLMTEPFGFGGVQSDLLTLTADLTARGHQVHVATTAGVLLQELVSRGAIHAPVDFRFRSPAALVRAAGALRRLVIAEKIELVAPQSVRSALAAYFALSFLRARHNRPPIVVTIHNIHTPFHFRYAGRILDRCADFVIFESRYEYTRVTASGLPAHKACVIHSGIDTDRFRPAPPCAELLEQLELRDSRPVYGIVARLSEEKGHIYLVAAFALVLKRLPQARLLIVGDGPLLEAVRDQVAALRISSQVIFAGSQRDVPRYLSLVDVFVLASTRESFPLAAREAMAAGKPVIAPAIGGCPEVVDDGVTGYLFPAGNVEQLADRMVAIADGERLRSFSAAARERAQRLFSRESWVAGDESVYLRWLHRPT